MSDEEPIRQPLRLLSQAEKEAIQKELGVDSDNDPLGLSPAEKLAARAIPPTEMKVELKPGWKTSEFWLHALVVVVLLPLLAWLTSGTSPLGEMLDALKSVSPLFAVLIPLIKAPVYAFLGWVAMKLATKYSDDRTALKTEAAKSE